MVVRIHYDQTIFVEVPVALVAAVLEVLSSWSNAGRSPGKTNVKYGRPRALTVENFFVYFHQSVRKCWVLGT